MAEKDRDSPPPAKKPCGDPAAKRGSGTKGKAPEAASAAAPATTDLRALIRDTLRDVLKEQKDGAKAADVTGDILSPGGAGRGKEEEYQPFLFSDGFPPVPAKLVGKILRLEFVDMAELLRDNIETERRQGRQREAAGVPAKQQQRREVPDILSWIQCFGIYVSVVASKFPERVSRMLAYQTTPVRGRQLVCLRHCIPAASRYGQGVRLVQA